MLGNVPIRVPTDKRPKRDTDQKSFSENELATSNRVDAKGQFQVVMSSAAKYTVPFKMARMRDLQSELAMMNMRFRMLDEIVEIEPGVRLTAIKELRPEEEYLKDHFPRFPVMPGVLMLEAMFQAAMWLVRSGEEFAHSVVLLSEAKNVKYADFVEPGQVLKVQAQLLKQDERFSSLKAQGTVDERMAVSGRLVLERFNVSDQMPVEAPLDAFLRRSMYEEFQRLFRPEESVKPAC
jgi:3-hydroxyacyl-[acyl-carrier-protein] dehydratase